MVLKLGHIVCLSVGGFRTLLAWCEQDLDRVKAVQRVLKVMRGWEVATAHARSAVPEDNHPRMFRPGPGVAYLFAAKHGKVDLGNVTGEHPECGGFQVSVLG